MRPGLGAASGSGLRCGRGGTEEGTWEPAAEVPSQQVMKIVGRTAAPGKLQPRRPRTGHARAPCYSGPGAGGCPGLAHPASVRLPCCVSHGPLGEPAIPCSFSGSLARAEVQGKQWAGEWRVVALRETDQMKHGVCAADQCLGHRDKSGQTGLLKTAAIHPLPALTPGPLQGRAVLGASWGGSAPGRSPRLWRPMVAGS